MKSFFDKLTGTNNLDKEIDELIDFENDNNGNNNSSLSSKEEDNYKEGELAVDIYDEGENIIVKAMIAGVKPEDLDVSITRDMITIHGSRHEEKEMSKDNYHQQELYWGSFSRTIMLPAEVDISESEAHEKHGLLVLTLPKVDKEKRTKLKIR
ncbi:MAG: Hsp20/alpha crystallin family protein [Candidatus Pacebacteria bacterium]|nr:Hsp20/alpha crystallin family protein [Candidatus Paceibacterota bacterium]